MAYMTSYFESTNCLMLVFSEVLTHQDVIDAVRDIPQYLADGKCISGVISDYSGVTGIDISTEGILRIAKATIELSRELKELHVAVAAPKKSVFGLSRMWEFHSSDTGWTCDTFTSRDEAEAWLCGKLNVSSICGHA